MGDNDCGSRPRNNKILALFDVDGTLTESRKKICPEMDKFMRELNDKIVVGIVGGSDLKKQKEQLGDDVADVYEYSFSENGLIAYRCGERIHSQSITKFLGEEKLKEFINFVLQYLSTVDCPVKRGNFIEFRSGMLNISPIGRQCSQEERDDFEKFDEKAQVRKTMVSVLKERFGEKFSLQFSIGGQISFDVFPKGWDKTYCLRFVENEGYDEIHFFGDKTFNGGNDYEIYSDERTIGHSVASWRDTMQICRSQFL